VDQLEQVIKSELKEKSDSNSGKDKHYKIIPLTKEDLEGTDGAIHLDGILTKFKGLIISLKIYSIIFLNNFVFSHVFSYMCAFVHLF
jgi:hypothetical protein